MTDKKNNTPSYSPTGRFLRPPRFQDPRRVDKSSGKPLFVSIDYADLEFKVLASVPDSELVDQLRSKKT